MRRFIEDFKMKNIAFFLLFFLLVSGHSNANAVGGSIGGWQVVSNVASGIGAKITATKDVLVNGAKTTVTGTANIMPDPSNMGKFMARLGGAAVVTEAMNQLLDGVDYVMDPVNNTVRYYDKDSGPAPDPNYYYVYNSKRYNSLAEVCTAYLKYNSLNKHTCTGGHYPNNAYITYSDGISGSSTVVIPRGQRTEPVEDTREPKSVPVATLSAQILDKAEQDIKAGNVASPAVVLSRAVAQDMVQEAETDDTKARPIATELDKNISYPSDTDVDGEITKPEVIDPVTGEVVKPAETSSIAMKFLKACEWFPQACVFIDWAMTDPNVDSDMEVPEKEIDKQEIKKDLVKISGRSCPSDVKFDVDGLPFGIKVNKAYSMQEICNTVEPLKYVFELITSVICALILLRV